ncbi:Ig-like domain-containing protein [Sphingomonas sp. IC-56]|uniref:Ig-like domain-containing protein n=1 Tax=Sphingomonas sp. IC-56 TaxID=2898529 RepID=UPI001E599FA8|nr:Ig-like domain-containing protein [Sphingomonas sp. IC-56]
MTMTALAFVSTALALVLLAPQSRPVVAPKVISVSPATGSTVASGTVTIRVRFDQPMRSDGWSFVRVAGGETPTCSNMPRQLADGQSFELDCRVEPGRSYALGFNGGSFWNFRGTNGLAAEAAVLRFRTRR